jgi:aspartate aminotransferase-like enzyme
VPKQLLFIPGPVTVAEPVLAAMGKPMIDHRGPEFKELQGAVVRKLQPVFGTTSDVLLLGCSGTGGLEAAMTNMFGAGEKVLVAPVGVFGNRFAEIARTWGVEVEILETEWGNGVNAGALKARLEADTAKEIKGVILTHNETSTGVQNVMGPLADAIRAHGAYSLVDSVSGLAASEFTMDAWGFDVVVAASQKALGVPPGMAMVAVSARAWDKMKSVKSPRYYLDLQKAREFQAIGQTPCTPPVSIAYALDVALDLYAQEGAQNVWARHERNTNAIIAAAEAMGLKLFAEPGMRSVTVTAIHVPAGISGDEIRKKLRVERGYVLGGGQEKLAGKIIRIGTMGAVTQNDIVEMLTALETELIAAGHNAKAGSAAKAATEAFRSASQPVPA